MGLMNAEAAALKEGGIVCVPSEAAPAGRPEPSELLRSGGYGACGVSSHGAETGLPAPLPEAWPMALCTFRLGQRFHNNLPLSNASRITQNTYIYSSL